MREGTISVAGLSLAFLEGLGRSTLGEPLSRGAERNMPLQS